MGGPSAPAIVNLTCHSQDSITIRWKRPYEFYNTIDFYVIKTRLAGQDTHRDIRINASAKELETAVSEGKEGKNSRAQANDSQCCKGQTVSRTIYQRLFRRQLLWELLERGRRDKALLSMVCKKGVFSRYFFKCTKR